MWYSFLIVSILKASTAAEGGCAVSVFKLNYQIYLPLFPGEPAEAEPELIEVEGVKFEV